MDLIKEINLIKNNKIHDAVRECYDSLHNKLKDLPSSSSGKWHPEDERGSGGLMLHVKRAVFFLYKEMFREFPSLKKYRDEMLASIICHDFGRVIATTHEDHQRHPELSNVILEPFLDKHEVNNKQKNHVMRMIKNHMSHWDDGFEPTEITDKMICVCDYVVSRWYFKTPILDEEV